MHESKINDQPLVPKVVSLSHIGGRSTQQDHIWPLPNESVSFDGQSDLLLVVADGAGGHKGGALASKIAVDTIVKQYRSLRPKQKANQALVNAIREAHENVQDRQQLALDKQNMASTVVTLALTPKLGEKNAYYISVANVGDSRAYLYRPNFALTQLSKDHTLVQEEVRQNNLTPEQAKIHPLRHRLSQSLGGKQELNIYSRPLISAKKHDRYLLCSDGLTDVLDDAHIQAILSQSASTTQTADMLMKQALLHAEDNVSFVLLDLIPMASNKKDRRAKELIRACISSILILCLSFLLAIAVMFYSYPESLAILDQFQVFNDNSPTAKIRSGRIEPTSQSTSQTISNRKIVSKTALPTEIARPTKTIRPSNIVLPSNTVQPTISASPILIVDRNTIQIAATLIPSSTPIPPAKIVEYRTGADRIIFESMVGWGGQDRACNKPLSITERLDFAYAQATRPVVEPIVEQRGADIYIKFDAVAANTRSCGDEFYHEQVITPSINRPSEWIIKNAKLTKKFAPSASPNKYVIPIDSNSDISQGGWIIGVDWQ